MMNATMSRMRGRVVAVMVALAVLLVAPPAFAEGSWNSYMTGVKTGFDSRTWTDRNYDAAGTIIWQSTCSRSSIDYQLRKGWWESRGSASYLCVGYRQFNFGRQSADSYYFRVIAIDGISGNAGTVNVPSVGVSY